MCEIRGSSRKKKEFVGIEERQTHLDTTNDGVESWKEKQQCHGVI